MAGDASEFTKKVIEVVRAVPSGKVVSYGQVALYAGTPNAARGVGWILRQTKEKSVPWWRVINNQGRISIKGNWEHEAEEQRDLLRKEGVEVSERFEIEIERYRYLAE
jgi:methylated-DNA-protein-cysteine methyltransferase-like protein